MISKLSYCGELVRAHDPDRFLISLFLPAAIREDVWALFAFNHEIAKTREVVSETQLGLIRLQWWRDAIGQIYSGEEVLQHEVVKPLAAAIARYDLKREYFDALIYAREFDLEDVMPTHLDGTLLYADATSTPLFKLALQIMGAEPEGAEPVQVIATNYALAGVLRAVPFHALQKRCYLPEGVMHKYGVRKLYELKPEGDFKAVIRDVAAQFVPGLRPENRFLRAAHVLAGIYMKQLRACDYDVFAPAMARPPAFLAFRLWFHTMFNAEKAVACRADAL